MTPTAAVIGGTIIITGSSVLKDVHEGKAPIKPVVTGFMLGAALLLVAFVSPPLGKALAIMGIVGAVVTNGPAVAGIVGGLAGGSK